VTHFLTNNGKPTPTSSQKNKVKDEDRQLSRIHPVSEFSNGVTTTIQQIGV
jgi:hypothetical protein